MARLSELWKKGNGAPLANDLVQGGLGIDIANQRVYSKDINNRIFEITTDVPQTITQLLDVPTNYGNAGQVLKVNGSRTALEWADDTFNTLPNINAGNGLAFGIDGRTLDVNAGDGLQITFDFVGVDDTVARTNRNEFFEGNVTAVSFFGDGSRLTGVLSGATVDLLEAQITANREEINSQALEIAALRARIEALEGV